MMCRRSDLHVAGLYILVILALLAGTSGEARCQLPHRAVLSASAGAAVGDAEFDQIPVWSVRASYRFDKDNRDFAAFAEFAEGYRAQTVPDGCVVTVCTEYFSGYKRLRAWHVGMETRLAGYDPQSRFRVTLGAGIGQMHLVLPPPGKGGESFREENPSVMVGGAVDGAISAKLGWRLSANAYAGRLNGADKALKGVWEVAAIQLGVYYGLIR